MEAAPSPARCVHCGGAVPLLYRRYSATVLKTMSCGRCGQVADKYIECDPVLVLLDLVLLNRQAIRHTLYNTAFRNHWKLCVVMVLIEGYVAYCGTSTATSSAADNPWPANLSADAPQLDGERLFYVICVESLMASLAFLAASALGCRILGARVSLRRLVKALVLGSFPVFLWVPALIWSQPERRWQDTAFIDGYTFLALMQTVSLLCAASRTRAAFVAAVGLGAKAVTRSVLRERNCLLF